MPPTRDQAICIRHWDWSETSQTAWLFTRAHGFVRGLAKGSRRPGSAYSGGIELLTRAHAAFFIKPASELALITEWDLAEAFPALHTNLHLYYAALYASEITQLLVRDQDPHPELFDALLNCLQQLTTTDNLHPQLLCYQLQLLQWSGFAPRLDTDIHTGTPLQPVGVLTFIPELGGFSATKHTEHQHHWHVRGTTLQTLRQSAMHHPHNPQSLPHSDHTRRAGALLAAYVRHLIGSEAKTFPLVYGPLS